MTIEYIDRMPSMTEYAEGKRIDPKHTDLILRADAIEAVLGLAQLNGRVPTDSVIFQIKALPSAEAVTIHDDGTLEVKVPNAQKVGRVLVMDTDSHIGGGLFYPDEAVPQSEQYKKGFEDAKRAFLIEYARESDNMRKRNAQLEVMLNAQKAISARPQGEWVEPQLIYTDAHKVTCTNCGGRVVIVGETNFCPNCGADMRGKKNGDK